MAEPDGHHDGPADQADPAAGQPVPDLMRFTEQLVPGLTRYTTYLMRRAYTYVSSKSDRATVARDYAVLAALAAGHVDSQLALAERLEINRTIMVKLIDRLQAEGAVTRTRNPQNRRSYLLRLTDAGRAALVAMEPAMRERDRTITAGLTDRERERFNELLRTLLGQPEKTPETVSTEHLVTQVFFMLRRRGDACVADAGLRIRHYAALFVIDTLGPCPQQLFARGLGLGEPAAALSVDELVDKGLVERGQDPDDRRRYALELTPLGREQLKVLMEAMEEMEADVVRTLGGPAREAELHGLIRGMLAMH